MRLRMSLTGASAIVLLAIVMIAPALTAHTGSAVDDHLRGASTLSTFDIDTVPSPGIAIGITSYDIQHNYAQGHQIASNPGSETVHFAWTMWDAIPQGVEVINRFANFNSWDKPSGTMNQGFNGTSVTLGEFARGGFVRLDVDSDNLCHAALHQRIESDYPYSAWHLEFPIEGSGIHLDQELEKDTTWRDENEHLWCDVAIEQRHGSGDNTTDVWHVVAMGIMDIGGGLAIASDRIWYWRYDRGAATPVWEGPVVIDSCTSIDYTIDAADDSGKVAVAFTSAYATDGLNGMNNVAYRESRTAGSGWLSGAELGESNKNIITAYNNPNGGPQAWVETSTAYDHRGVLHIVYIEQRMSGSEQVALKHWSNEHGSITTITEAHYDNPGNWVRALNIAQISLGIGDGATFCYGGTIPNQDFLYVLYTKLGGQTPDELADTSALGFANGELFLTGSPDGGTHWSAPVNLTNTKSPGCKSVYPDSTCASEAWATIARDVSDIEILYIRDYEPGCFDEAPWTMNKVMYLNYPGGMADAPFLCPGSGCFCPCHGDPQCDGIANVIDVVITIMVAFRDGDEVFDYDCLRSRTDVNCDGVTNVLDVVLFVDVTFRNAEPGAAYCDPCVP